MKWHAYCRNELAIIIICLCHAPFSLLLSGTMYANLPICDVMMQQTDPHQYLSYFCIAVKKTQHIQGNLQQRAFNLAYGITG